MRFQIEDIRASNQTPSMRHNHHHDTDILAFYYFPLLVVLSSLGMLCTTD
jgi:hypothetical protein